MAKISNAYTPLEIELVRGSTETIRLNVKEALPSTAWMDLTGSTVIFRAASKSDSIRKEIVSVVATAIESTVGKYLDSSAKQKLAEEATKETLKVESFIK
jgi:hypothetical protein